MRNFRGSVVFLVLCAVSAWAQSTTDGAISGLITDASGRYTLIHLQPGTYELEIKANGLATLKTNNVVVEVGRATTMDLVLAVAGTSETLTVNNAVPVVNTEQ